MTDLYSQLGITLEASFEDIKNAYRKKAKELHPDVNKDINAHQDFIEVSEAYEILRDPELRREYDRLYKAYKENANTDDFESSYRGFKSSHESTYENARYYSEISLESVLESIKLFAFELGKGILLGEEDKPKLGVGDFLLMGFWGLFFIGAIVILFTGFGTIPGMAMLYIGGKSFFKGDKFYGILPMLLSTLLYIGVIFLIIMVVANVDNYSYNRDYNNNDSFSNSSSSGNVEVNNDSELPEILRNGNVILSRVSDGSSGGTLSVFAGNGNEIHFALEAVFESNTGSLEGDVQVFNSIAIFKDENGFELTLKFYEEAIEVITNGYDYLYAADLVEFSGLYSIQEEKANVITTENSVSTSNAFEDNAIYKDLELAFGYIGLADYELFYLLGTPDETSGAGGFTGLYEYNSWGLFITGRDLVGEVMIDVNKHYSSQFLESVDEIETATDVVDQWGEPSLIESDAFGNYYEYQIGTYIVTVFFDVDWIITNIKISDTTIEIG